MVRPDLVDIMEEHREGYLMQRGFSMIQMSEDDRLDGDERSNSRDENFYGGERKFKSRQEYLDNVGANYNY